MGHAGWEMGKEGLGTADWVGVMGEEWGAWGVGYGGWGTGNGG